LSVFSQLKQPNEKKCCKIKKYIGQYLFSQKKLPHSVPKGPLGLVQGKVFSAGPNKKKEKIGTIFCTKGGLAARVCLKHFFNFADKEGDIYCWGME
jgi:hypothetical protein